MRLKIDCFTSWVEIEGVEAECHSVLEYSDRENGGKTVKCWIASEAGKTFSVHWSDSTRAIDTIGVVSVDGVWTRNPTIRSRHSAPQSKGIASSYGKRSSESTIRPYTFTPICLTDDESACASAADVEKLGHIQLEIKRITFLEERYISSPAKYCFQNKPVYERSKKAAVHKVSYGNEIPAPRGIGNARKEIRHETVAKFIFMYTSYDMLHAKDVIPARISLPSPIEPDPTNQTDGRQMLLGNGVAEKKKRKRSVAPQEDDSLQSGLSTSANSQVSSSELHVCLMEYMRTPDGPALNIPAVIASLEAEHITTVKIFQSLSYETLVRNCAGCKGIKLGDWVRICDFIKDWRVPSSVKTEPKRIKLEPGFAEDGGIIDLTID